MNMKNIFFITLATFTFACFASEPANKIAKPHEVETRKIIKKETTIGIDFFVSKRKNAEQIGTLQCTYNPKKDQGVIDFLEVYKGFRNFGYGTAWFKKAIIALAAFNPKSMYWEAQPLDHTFDRQALLNLIRFYTRYGGLVINKHIDKENNHAEMQYPIALARALTILHPIFETQEKSAALAHQKQEDPFALIVAYANMDLKNKDLK